MLVIMSDWDELNKLAEDFMRANNLSRAEFARMVGVSQSQMSKILNGLNPPGRSAVNGMARVLRIPPERALSAAGYVPKRSPRSVLTDSMVHIFEQLEPAEQERVLRMIEAYVDGAAHPRQTPPRTDESPA